MPVLIVRSDGVAKYRNVVAAVDPGTPASLELDRRILGTLIDHYDGGPAGLKALAAAVGEDHGTIEDLYEPFLIQEGFLQRTPRGRVATRREARGKGLGNFVMQAMLDWAKAEGFDYALLGAQLTALDPTVRRPERMPAAIRSDPEAFAGLRQRLDGCEAGGLRVHELCAATQREIRASVSCRCLTVPPSRWALRLCEGPGSLFRPKRHDP